MLSRSQYCTSYWSWIWNFFTSKFACNYGW